MGDTSCTDAVRAAVAALNSGDIDGYLKAFHPLCRRWIVGFEQPLSLPDIDENLRHLSAAFHPLTLDTESLFGADGKVCARWRLRGTHTHDFLGHAATGQHIDVRTCEVYEFAGATVRDVWTYGDPMDLFRQISDGGHA
jgi:predicted ester cyclase